MRIIERDGFQCQLCGRYVEGHSDTHVDHTLPLSRGGDESDSNKQTLCADCNLKKGDR
jgi:5-methylcytosine-specific restriction enzyme A